jgi:hypothetical protein
MSTIEQKLAAMGLALPPPREFPSPNRRGAVRVGTILFLSGHGPASSRHEGARERQARLGQSRLDVSI